MTKQLSPSTVKLPLAIHPLCDMYGEMTPDDFKEFKQDIADNGLDNPRIIIYENQILDGKLRIQAATQLGLDLNCFEVHEFTGTYEEAIRLTCRLNVKRQMFTPAQLKKINRKLKHLMDKHLTT